MEKVAKTLAEALAIRSRVDVLTTAIGAPGSPRRECRAALSVRRFSGTDVAHVPIAPRMLIALMGLPRQTIVHVHVAQALVPEFVWVTSRLRRRPYVAHFHLDVDPSGRLGVLLALYKRIMLRRVLRDAARVLVLTREQAAFVTTRYGVSSSRLVVLPNGVEDRHFLDRPTGAASTRALRLLFVGRLSPQKNVALLLDALAELSEPVELAIVGDGEERQRLMQKADKLRLSNVRFVGARYDNQLIEWYRWADVFVLPSWKEGMPLAVLEAMAGGLPVVATDVPGTRELVGRDGLLVALDAGALAGAVRRLFAEPQLRAALAARSAARARQYRWSSVIERLEGVYDEVRHGEPAASPR